MRTRDDASIVLLQDSGYAPDPARKAGLRCSECSDCQRPERSNTEVATAEGGQENLIRLQEVSETDAKGFSERVVPHGGRISECLVEHESGLVTGCCEAIRLLHQSPKDDGEVGQSFGGTQLWA